MDLISNALQIMMNEDGVDVEPILITHNGEYTAPEGKAYSPVNVQTPVYNITPLTLTHNHQGAEAGLYGGYSPVQVDIEMDTLNVPTNGVYEIDTTTQDGWDTVLVDVYEKYHELYTGGANMSPQICYFNDDVNTNNYDEFWLGGQYLYSEGGNRNIAIWNGRYPTSVLSSIYTNNGAVGSIGGHNAMWWTPDSTGKFMTNRYYGYDYPYAFFGVKNKDRTEECLWANTGSTTPSTVTLSESIFDYDEICLYFVKGDGVTTTSWYLTDELSVGDVVQGYDNTSAPATLNKYTIASNTTLTVLSESGGYVLMGVYGVNDTSLSETTLYANPDPTTAPATVTLSDSYTNYDEIVLIGHIPSEDTVCSYSYPVKILGRWTHDAYRDRIGVFSCQMSFWLTFTSNTTLVADANPTIILDKIIGIKRPVVSASHELIDVEPLSVTQNGTYTAPTGKAYSPVTVDATEKQPVTSGATIYDYDGTVIATYTPEEFAALSAYPAHPEHEYLTPNGYNTSLTTAKTYAANHGYVEVGAQYNVTDGKTRLFMTFIEDALEPRLGLGVEGSVDIDWGDGSAHDILTGSSATTPVYSKHVYSQAGKYIITLTVTEGTATIFGARTPWYYTYFLSKDGEVKYTLNKIYCNAITDILIGDNIKLGDYAFQYCENLRTVLVPSNNTLTSFGAGVFYLCHSLIACVIPSSVSSFDNVVFNDCKSMLSVVLSHDSSAPLISTGMFSGCTSLQTLVIPDSITSIGGSGTSGGSGLNAIYNCYGLKTIVMSANVTYICNTAFQYCYNLNKLDLPNSLTTVGVSAFDLCLITNLVIPVSLTEITARSFAYMYALKSIKFIASTPPTITYQNAFESLPTDCIIYVPSGSLSAYTSASNYPDPNTYTYVEY